MSDLGSDEMEDEQHPYIGVCRIPEWHTIELQTCPLALLANRMN